MMFSEAAVALSDPERLVADLVDHMNAHDVAHDRIGRRVVVHLGLGDATLEPDGGILRVRVEAPDEGGLEMMRSVVASNVVDFAGGDPPQIVWSGFTAGAETFSNFRELRLVEGRSLTPRLRRLTFTGADLGRFADHENLHVRLYLPPPDVARPEWPRPGPDGRTIWPDATRRPDMRYYTIRRAEAKTVEIDFVLHDAPGPGARFALHAEPGAICGIAGPLGRTASPAAWTLLVGDETALPAIARILDAMPADAQGIVLLEAESEATHYPLRAFEGVPVRWLERRADAESPLIDSVRRLEFPMTADVFVWAGCESTIARSLRRILRSERGLSREKHLVVGYWDRDEPTTR
ncbi:siderophore-interacting protein [Methylorubrum suomiense]|uniref:FAD-binding FR-type domain-containing protein n=1 Tax=Methylorubrum suomiense TaxID=144191 RepID=A0ABQ4UUZ7_9HYPH|nr:MULTISPECIES: siderophore-interacting protein [Methylobacteriaceae]GJE76141.1 hypothetical protein BGCPKDLD_2733 [Methylorubrum suomiense]